MLIELREVAKSYRAVAAERAVSILDRINLKVEQGESVAIVGPSGSGKSTLLNLVGALDSPSSGQVLLDGKNLSTLGDRELAAVRNQQIGFIFQMHHLLPQCSVFENVLIPTLADSSSSISSSQIENRASDLLKRVGLESRLDHRPGQLSGGECQRVAVVRALINRPKLLLADEPTGALDRASAEDLVELLVALNREDQVALMVVTHWPEFARRMSRVYELRDKTLVQMV
jgi:ABC-type lipoprotein export system ATPase subunit